MKKKNTSQTKQQQQQQQQKTPDREIDAVYSLLPRFIDTYERVNHLNSCYVFTTKTKKKREKMGKTT